MVVSRDNADYLRFAFPELTVTQVRNAIDAAFVLTLRIEFA